ncbi:MAG: hypothetical protein HYR91_07570 [Flavobacteriia bacterium]|nr:hypothetical protein [Flavobacteriia bacterium]
MKIYLTFDYELFFGSVTGSVAKCILNPTNDLLDLVEKYHTPMTFFVDAGYLIALEKNKLDFPEFAKDLDQIKAQIQRMILLNCSVQLHIHPHWEKAIYKDSKWIIDTTNCYKIHDFSDDEIGRIFRSYKNYLDELTGMKSTVFRAGGWCIQPFDRLKKSFLELGLKIDSSVFEGGYFESKDYYFDFRTAPNKSKYYFESDICKESEHGSFMELPISSYRYSPLFYWRLYILGRLFPKRHKMVGDGIYLAQPGRKKSVLTHFTWNHISTDGYYASNLNKGLKKHLQNQKQEYVSIGHPKCNTHFSMKILSRFIRVQHVKHEFCTLDSEL